MSAKYRCKYRWLTRSTLSDHLQYALSGDQYSGDLEQLRDRADKVQQALARLLEHLHANGTLTLETLNAIASMNIEPVLDEGEG